MLVIRHAQRAVTVTVRAAGGFLAALLLLLSGCSDRDRLTDGGGNGGTFSLGPETSYPIPAGTDVAVPDSISGGTFVLATGGGTVRVARIASGPAPSAPGESFWVGYEGPGRIRLEISDDPDVMEILYGYGIDMGSIDDEIGRVERWTCVPVAESLQVSPGIRSVRYELIPQFERGGREKAGTHLGFGAYHLAQLTPQSTSVQRFEAAKRQGWNYLGAVIDSLPSAMAGYVATQTASGATYEPTFYNSEDHKYKGFLYLSALFPITDPSIYLGPAASEHTVAHEMGHFINHILAGEQKYLVLEAQAPDEHAPGEEHPNRSSIMEDYAHFCDYFCTGTVLNVDSNEPYSFFESFTGSRGLSPSAVDWPSLEGFGTVMLTSLIRRSSTIRTSATRTQDFPVIGANFPEVWRLVAAGAPNINVLRDSVETFLAARGKRALMPVFGERIGWRYHGRGRLVDADGNPIKNASVTAIYSSGNKIWRTPGSATSGSDGIFTISRLFPGQSRLRVGQGTDSTDVDIEIPWSRPTNNEVDLGDLVVAPGLLAQLQQTRWVDIHLEAAILFSDGYTSGGVSLTTFQSFNGGQEPGWAGAEFDLDYSLPTSDGSYSLSMSGAVSASGRELLQLTVTEHWVTATTTWHNEFSLNDVPVDEDNIYPDEVWFSIEGPSVQAHVSNVVGGNLVEHATTVVCSHLLVPASAQAFQPLVCSPA